MRRLLILALLTIAIVVALFLLLERSSGYVLVSYAEWQVEMSVVIALAIFAITFLVIYSIVQLIFYILRAPKSISIWNRRHRSMRGMNKTTQGLVAYVEGRWQMASRLLDKAANSSATPLVNYLFAAKASSAYGDDKAVDLYLKKAASTVDGADVAIGLTQAEMQVEKQQFELALATLTRVKRKVSGHPVTLTLLAKTYRGLKDWEGLLQLLPQLSNSTLISEQVDDLSLLACEGLLQGAKDNKDMLRDRWRKIPSNLKKKAAVKSSYAKALVAIGAHDEAEALTREGLSTQIEQDLLDIYVALNDVDINRRLNFLQKLANKNAGDPAVTFSLIDLYMQSGKKEEASVKAEAVLPSAQRVRDLALIAKLYLSLGDKDKALTLYEKASVAAG